MTARIDSYVKATIPTLASAPARDAEGAARPALSEAALALRDKGRAEREQARSTAAALWTTINEAGGTDAWVKAQLQQKGLGADVDPTTLSDREKGQYKARKKAEAEERRALKAQAYAAYRATHVGYLGAGVYWTDEEGEADRLDIAHREERARDNGLPALKGAGDLARALGMNVPRLRWLAFHREVDSGTHYHRFTIPKRDGRPRLIAAPKRYLKEAQRWLLREIAEKLPVHGAAHGFLPSRSIVTNASVHAGAHTVVKLDIQDFFPTVTTRRVKGLLRKAGLAEPVAVLVAQLCTEPPRELVQHRGQLLHVATGPRALPQGAPTSPALTNALCLRMDKRLSGLARKLGFRYTRYADDLAFSYRPPVDAAGPHPRAPIGSLLRGAAMILQAEGFQVNPRKTRVLRNGDCQRITGLVVNQAPGAAPARVPRTLLRQLRAALHNREQGRPGKEGESLAQLRGLCAFVHMTDEKLGKSLLQRIDALEARR